MSNAHLYDRILRILQIAAELGEHRRHEIDKALGRSQGYFRRVVSGEAPLRVADLLRLIEVLEVPLEELFGPLVLGGEGGEIPRSPDDLLLRLSRLLNARGEPPRPLQPAAESSAQPPHLGEDIGPTVRRVVMDLLKERGLLKGGS